MQSTDLKLTEELEPHRRKLQRRVKTLCYSAVILTAIIMLTFFSTLAYRGIGAFTQTQIQIDVKQIESNTKKTINSALYSLVEEPDRKTKKGLRQLATPNAYSTMQIDEPGS